METAGRAAKGVVLRTALRPPPPLDAVITRVVQLRVAETKHLEHLRTSAPRMSRQGQLIC
ncbi:Os07g0174766 [Oryza sativa Japonica Group]|uniref:Uncharacterized protein n=2 Tax=Oryza sativa subsp. japonica TaxID=39947 RepID=A0A8J8XDY9_ORYSJ|nr:hypothetical protein OsJ_10447 [Oryza sativa Japonica Group]BAT00272.1 Os07g0174766 [Oryza sativa Japonica Group]